MTDLSLPPDSTLPAARARISLWGGGPWADPARRDEAREAAREVEALGYSRIWLSGGFDPGLHPVFGELLDATEEIGVASGIVSVYAATPEQTGQGFADLERRHPGRFLLGLGNSHAVVVEGSGQDYSKPYSRTVEHLDALDATGSVPRERRALAALGPRMLRLARDRSLGAHPYFTTPAHTTYAREVVGDGVLLAPEVAVVLEDDPAKAREIARRYATGYLALPNYTNNLRRFGYGDEDFADGGSERLIDELIPWGDTATVVAGLARHVDAGADEIAVQVLTASGDEFPLGQWEELARALIG
ncbi:TIGR03620 family F420-dependent LLM class oxidoreductase [Paenibacillus sp. TRM 82003]|uniref:TIGR03620 family F420-dependent LLM class oxidoreductase n=1 Tax=Kineococcus sp. TRM81007 TaxID=2925831 RepID=UPI001F56428E|nr:TIGR03620 family F420-dependent LLM class oxidoreductase [Kineococcus sp. TRM81007]MCI2237431.1 TIGR03620 family F420-dependent LLM class oxidoreductase [Kineococcus sp. TRM81007]MCI3919783.1 TIGR03620 family F420-dependent LLM class oxidoreductase [Paenibacillus sp. TRM 82003]